MVIFPSEFSSKAGKYIKKLDAITKKRIEERIDKLELYPFPQEVERVEDCQKPPISRMRVSESLAHNSLGGMKYYNNISVVFEHTRNSSNILGLAC